MAIKTKEYDRLVFGLWGSGTCTVEREEKNVTDKPHCFLQLFHVGNEYFFQFFDDGLDIENREVQYKNSQLASSDYFKISKEKYDYIKERKIGFSRNVDLLLRHVFGGREKYISRYQLDDNCGKFSSKRSLTFIGTKVGSKDDSLHMIYFDNGYMEPKGLRGYNEAVYQNYHMVRHEIHGECIDITVKNVDNNKLRVDPKKYIYDEIEALTEENFGIFEYNRYWLGLRYCPKKDRNSFKWVVLNGKGDGYKPDFDSLEVRGEKNKQYFEFSNELIIKNNVIVCCSGDIGDFYKSGKNEEDIIGLNNVKINASYVHHYDNCLIPVESLTNFNPSTLKKYDDRFEMTFECDGIKYRYEGRLTDDGLVDDILVHLEMERDVPEDAIIDRENLVMDEKKIASLAKEAENKINEAKEAFSYSGKCLTGGKVLSISHWPKDSEYFIGNYEGKTDTSRNHLFQKTDIGARPIGNLDKPLYVEELPNKDIMVVQENKDVVILDAEAKMPKAYIHLFGNNDVRITIVGKEEDYELHGIADNKGHLTELLATIKKGEMLAEVPIYVDDAKTGEDDKDITIDEVIRLIHEKISYYGCKPKFMKEKK